MSMQHTPGPWDVGVHEDGSIGIVAGGCGIARVFADRGVVVPIPPDTAIANARVMAAAPVLLEACRAQSDSATPDWCNCSEAAERGKCRHMLAAAAVFEATGERLDGRVTSLRHRALMAEGADPATV